MITTRGDYSYVGGDIAQVVINGEIMPLRSAARKNDVRGVDPCFLLEGCLERLGWWTAFSNQTGVAARNVTNPNALGTWGSSTDIAPFSRRVEIGQSANITDISQCTGIGAASALVHKIYTPGSFSVSGVAHRFGFLSSLPANAYNHGLGDFMEVFDAQGIRLKQSAMSFDGFASGGVIARQPVENLFTDLARANYAYLSIPIRQWTFETASVKDQDMQWPAEIKKAATPGYSFLWSESGNEWSNDNLVAHLYSANFILPGAPAFFKHEATPDFNSSYGVYSFEVPAARDATFFKDNTPHVFANVTVHGSWGSDPTRVDSSGRTHTFVNCATGGDFTQSHLLDLTNVIGHRTRYYAFGMPKLTDALMRNLVARGGGTIYTEADAEHPRFSQYQFSTPELIVVMPFSWRTRY